LHSVGNSNPIFLKMLAPSSDWTKKQKTDERWDFHPLAVKGNSTVAVRLRGSFLIWTRSAIVGFAIHQMLEFNQASISGFSIHISIALSVTKILFSQ